MATNAPIRDQFEVVEQQHSVFEVAQYFLHKSQNDFRPNTDITHLKLQKLVYYAQAWHLAMLGRRLFEGKLEAWVHGPVSPQLYNEYRLYGYQVINNNTANLYIHNFSIRTQAVLNSVWQMYGNNDAKELEKLTHSELPWLNARADLPLDISCNNEILIQDMQNYYAAYLN